MNVNPPRPVLFLDDERAYIEMMTELLSEHLSCPIVPFTRPEDALAALPGLNPGMIVTDFSMQGMNGIDFLYRAQANGSTRCRRPSMPQVAFFTSKVPLARARRSPPSSPSARL